MRQTRTEDAVLPFDGIVLNKYQIRRSSARADGLLGSGTFGNVYLAHDELTDLDVAIKELHAATSGVEEQQELLRRFLVEGRLGVRIRNPYILEVFAIEVYESGYLLVMELAEGGDLKQLMTRERLSLARAVEIGANIATGLQAAHDRGIVHRDLKPANVLFTREGVPKIADFGVARIPEALGGYVSLTRSGVQPGTVIYMSPEQALLWQVDRRSDLYSLAVILFELVTGTFYVDLARCRQQAKERAGGKPGLEELRFFETFTQVAFEEPLVPPSARNPNVPDWLDAVILRGLARDREERWQSAAELAAALRAGTLPPETSSVHEDSTVTQPIASGGNGAAPSAPADSLSTVESSRATGAAVVPETPAAERLLPTQDRHDTTEAGYIRRPPSLSRRAATERAEPQAVARPSADEQASLLAVSRSAPPVPAAEPAGATAPSSNKAPSPLAEQGQGAGPSDTARQVELPVTIPDDTVTRARTDDLRELRTQPGRNGGAAGETPPIAATTPEPQRGRWRLTLLSIGAAVLLIAVLGTVLATRGGSGGKPLTTAVPTAAASTAVATPVLSSNATPALPTPTSTPSPSVSPTASPTPALLSAQEVPDAQLLRPNATIVNRQNIAGTGSDPGYIVLYSQMQGGDCPTPYLDVYRPGASNAWASVWDGTTAPATQPLLPAAQKTDAGCFPAVKLDVKPLLQGGQAATLVDVALAGGNHRLVVLQWNAAQQQVTLAYDQLFSVPGVQIGFTADPTLGFTVQEHAYPPPSSGLNPSYDAPIGQLVETVTYRSGGFAPGDAQLTPNCLSGKLTVKAEADAGKMLQIACPDGSPGGLMAVVLTDGTSFADGLTFDDLTEGDDVTLTLDETSLAPLDPLNVLPVAKSVTSSAASARKHAPTPAPAPPAAPHVSQPPVSAPPASQPVSPSSRSAPAPQSAPPSTSRSAPSASGSSPSQTYSPPAQSYSPPIQSYSPPTQSYAPQTAPQTYSPPVATVPPQAPARATVPPQAPARATVPPQQ